jgi:hypothetical protein
VKKRRIPPVISDDELIARYAYVLGNVPTSVADQAYAAAFTRLGSTNRQDIVRELGALLPVAPHERVADDPEAFAVLMRDLFARDALVRIRGAGTIAAEFIASPSIVAYFTVGAGSVTIDQQPPWIHHLAGHETAPIDGGRMQHRRGVNSGEWYGS